jgi:geranial dehydrogenase
VLSTLHASLSKATLRLLTCRQLGGRHWLAADMAVECWAADSAHATDVARRVDSGTVGVNGYMPSLGSPFGGVKGSGMGSEFGPEAVNGYMRTKSIYVMG